MDELNQPSCACLGAQCDVYYSNFQIFPCVTAVFRYANRGGLEHGQPMNVLDAFVDVAFVGGSGRTIFNQHFFWHTLIHTAASGQVGYDKHRLAISDLMCMPARHSNCDTSNTASMDRPFQLYSR